MHDFDFVGCWTDFLVLGFFVLRPIEINGIKLTKSHPSLTQNEIEI